MNDKKRETGMNKTIAAAVVLALAPFTQASAQQAADVAAGKAKVEEVCAACHGANGVSVADNIPNLAAQRAVYIEGQLRAFQQGARKAPNATSQIATMAAIATQLSQTDILNVAAYFASLPGPASGAKSPQLANLAKTHVTFPEGYKESFVKYHSISFPATKQVRYYYANKAAVEAAKANKPLPDGSYLLAEVFSAKLDGSGNPVKGADGHFVAEKPLLYTAMETGAGWGKDIPEMLRNGNWNYAIFTLDKKHRPINQAECLACHKPLDNVSYTFTLKELSAAK
jgi:cytochrome c553